MDVSFGAEEPQQIRVNFTTALPDLELPEEKRQLLIPGDSNRAQLSRVLNSEHMLNTLSPIPLAFRINGAFLKTSLAEYLKEHGLSFESTVTLEYVKALVPPQYQASFEHDDWVSDVDTLSATSRAGVWSGASYLQGQERILSASYDGLLRIWNGSGQVIATSPAGMDGGHVAPIKTAKFLSSSQIASAGMDRTVRVWKYTEAEDHFSGVFKPTVEMYGHRGTIEAMHVHDSGRLVTASSTGEIGLWTTSKSSAPLAPASLLPGAGSHKKRKIAASPAPQRGPLSLEKIHESAASAVIFHPEDRTVAYSASQDHTIRTIDLTTFRVVNSIPAADALVSLCSLPAKGLLAAGTSQKYITLVDPRASATTTSVMKLRGHKNFVCSLCASPEMDYNLVSGSHDGTCRIWDLRNVRSEGGGSASDSEWIIQRKSADLKKRKMGDIPGQGCKVLSVVWDSHWGIVSGGEDKQVQIDGPPRQ